MKKEGVMKVSCMKFKCPFHLCQRNDDQQHLQSVSFVSPTQKISLEKAESSTANFKCMFCKKITHKKEKALQNVSTFEAANNITQCAEAKGDKDMLRLLLGVSYDLVAAEAKYHKACFASYVSKSKSGESL